MYIYICIKFSVYNLGDGIGGAVPCFPVENVNYTGICILHTEHKMAKQCILLRTDIKNDYYGKCACGFPFFYSTLPNFLCCIR